MSWKGSTDRQPDRDTALLGTGIIITSVIQMRVVAQIFRRGDDQGRRRV